MCVLIFFTTFVKKFPILRRIQQHGVTMNVQRYPCKIPRYSCHILRRLEFPQQIFEKCPYI